MLGAVVIFQGQTSKAGFKHCKKDIASRASVVGRPWSNVEIMEKAARGRLEVSSP